VAKYGETTDSGAEEPMLAAQTSSEPVPASGKKDPAPERPDVVLDPPVFRGVPTRGRPKAQQNPSMRDEPVPDRNSPKPDPL
jgi:hypothetical protein